MPCQNRSQERYSRWLDGDVLDTQVDSYLNTRRRGGGCEIKTRVPRRGGGCRDLER